MRVLGAFEAAGLEYVLIGAAAMAIHGVVRATENLELFIRPTSENVERLRNALRTVYADDPHIDRISPTDLLGEYPAVRYYPPRGDLYLDMLTRLNQSVSFEAIDAESMEVDGTQVRVVTHSALYELKKRTIGLQGQADAAALRELIGKMKTEKRVQKFRSIEEMNKAPVPESRGSGSNFDRFLRHCARWWAIAPKKYPRGVFKFRSLEEAQKAREKHLPLK
jgi:hypothetical protein